MLWLFWSFEASAAHPLHQKIRLLLALCMPTFRWRRFQDSRFHPEHADKLITAQYGAILGINLFLAKQIARTQMIFEMNII
jgi:hypothetical protein